MKDFFQALSHFEIILLCIFAFAFVVQLFYYLFYYIRVALYKPKQNVGDQADFPAISVVICARDEEDNLKSFLPSVLEQVYPNFEVVVVDDCSTDDTDMVLKLLKDKYSHLRTTTIKKDEKFTHGKKLALTVGIKSAKHNWIVLTDADCKCVSSNWLTIMSSNFDDKTKVVLGYGGYFPEKGFLNGLIRFDTFFTALQYFSFARAGNPFMGVGRNLAYRKELFLSNRGFATHSHILSGDDDLFVHEVANGSNTRVEFRHESHTLSNPKKTFQAWMRQKKRHLTTGVKYKKNIKFLLVLEPFSRIIFWGLGIVLLTNVNLRWIALGAIGFRIVLAGVIIKIAMNRLNERKIFILSLMYDLLAPFLYFALHVANSVTPQRSKWN